MSRQLRIIFDIVGDVGIDLLNNRELATLINEGILDVVYIDGVDTPTPILLELLVAGTARQYEERYGGEFGGEVLIQQFCEGNEQWERIANFVTGRKDMLR